MRHRTIQDNGPQTLYNSNNINRPAGADLVQDDFITHDFGGQQFDLIYMVMDKSNPALPKTQTVVYYFYNTSFTYNQRGLGAAIVVCMLVIIMAITFILQKSEKKWVFYN